MGIGTPFKFPIAKKAISHRSTGRFSIASSSQLALNSSSQARGVPRCYDIQSKRRVVNVHCASLSANIVASSSSFTLEESDRLQLGTALRNLGFISFWSQLVLSVVSGVVLLFSMGVTSGGSIVTSPTDVCTLIGVGCGLFTSMLSWSWIRAGRKLGELKEIRLQQCLGTVLACTNLNLVGMGATIVGLQASVGGLVAKTLSSAAGGLYYNPRSAPPPVAFDVFSVQACTNTIMAHFVGMVIAQWLLRVLRKYIQKEEEKIV